MTHRARYCTIDVTPPTEAERGLRREHRLGGTAAGVARARGPSARRARAPATFERMPSFFARHDVDTRADGRGTGSDPSAGHLAWRLRGGRWADAVPRRMRRRDDGG